MTSTETRNNAALAGAAVASSLALAALPGLATLPALCGFDVEHTASDPLEITAQLGTASNLGEAEITAVLAWRDALPGAELRAHDMRDGIVHIAAHTILGGFPFTVWTHVHHVDSDVIRRVNRAASETDAAGILTAHYGLTS